MGLINRMRKQTAVYWALATVPYDDNGKPQHTNVPVEVRVRWEDRVEEYVDAEGTTQLSNSVVYVGEDMVRGEILMVGELTDVVDATDPMSHDGAYPIQRFDKLPDLKAKEFLRTAYL